MAWVLVGRHGAGEAERLVDGTRRGCEHYGELRNGRLFGACRPMHESERYVK